MRNYEPYREEEIESDLWFPADQCPLTGAHVSFGQAIPTEEWLKEMPPGFLVPEQTPRNIVKDLDAHKLHISENGKAIRSFNVRIAGYRLPTKRGREKLARGIAIDPKNPKDVRLEGGTCMPTQWCTEHCYAKIARFVTWAETNWDTMNAHQRRYMQNRILTKWYRKASKAELEREAARIVHYCRHRKPYFYPVPVNNLRWNGGGDFDSGSVKLVNTLTRLFERDQFESPQMRLDPLLGKLDSGPFRLWGFTRIAKWAKKLTPRRNLFIQISLDTSTPPFGPHGQHIDKLMEAAHKLGDSFVGFAFATEASIPFAQPLPGGYGLGERIDEIRYMLARRGLRLSTVFGYHCMGSHTEVGDPMECAATNPRVSGGCQTCRWCMTSNREKAAEGVRTPLDSYLQHGGQMTGFSVKRGGKVHTWPAMTPREAEASIREAVERDLVPWM